MALGFKRRAWKRSCNLEITRDKLLSLSLSEEARNKVILKYYEHLQKDTTELYEKVWGGKGQRVPQKQMPQKVKSK